MLRSANKQREVGDKLYDYYSDQRLLLIEELIRKHGRTQDQAIRITQKLLDRIVFIAFCEDRGLLLPRLLEETWKSVPPLPRAGVRWQNFRDLFHFVDKGHEKLDLTTGYNGGLFAPDDEIDKLDLSDRWTDIFKTIGEFDFAEDVNVDVLGHIFEKSITELEKLRTTGFFAAADCRRCGARNAKERRAQTLWHLLHTARLYGPNCSPYHRFTDRRSLDRPCQSAQRRPRSIPQSPTIRDIRCILASCAGHRAKSRLSILPAAAARF